MESSYNQFTAPQKVTLRRIPSHRAGITVSGFLGYASGEQIPTVVQILHGEKPAYQDMKHSKAGRNRY